MHHTGDHPTGGLAAPPRTDAARGAAVPRWAARLRTAVTAALGAAVTAAASWALLRVADDAWSANPAARTVDDVVLAVVGVLGAALAAWLAVGGAVSALALLPGALGRACAAAAERITPGFAKRLLSVVLGASVGTLALPGAVAVGAPAGADRAAAATGSGSASGAALPDSATAPLAPALTPGFTPSRDHGPDTHAAGERRAGVHAAPLGPGFRVTSASPASTAASTAASAAAPSTGATPSTTPTLTPTVAPTLTPSFAPTAEAAPGPSAAVTPPSSATTTPTAPPAVSRAARQAGPGLLAPAVRGSAADTGTVTVRRGDTLWSVAAAHLGPSATDAEIAREWPRWYAANRAVIGEDPDVLLPGQQLVAPQREVVR